MSNKGHLILSRKAHEGLVIQDEHGNDIAVVDIVEVGYGRVRVGILADKKYRVMRKELVEVAQ